MSEDGTSSYEGVSDLPSIVKAAVELAQSAGFTMSCIPEQGRLLQLLAAGLDRGTIGETGTGCGVGLAWMASAASARIRLVSIDIDADRVAATRRLFGAYPNVTILCGDWSELIAHGPFDLLVLDGGGQGKNGGDAFDPAAWLHPGASFVIDDFTPMTSWPPTFEGTPDASRRRWFDDDMILATEINLRTDAATLVARWRDGLPRSDSG
jgi:predicted O-methyltransferase YrrM